MSRLDEHRRKVAFFSLSLAIEGVVLILVSLLPSLNTVMADAVIMDIPAWVYPLTWATGTIGLTMVIFGCWMYGQR